MGDGKTEGIAQEVTMADAAAADEWAVQDEEPAAVDAIAVEIADATRFGALGEAWHALAARAAVPNVSMHPAVARAAEAAGEPVHVVLAWHPGGSHGTPRLVGAWVLAEAKPYGRWPFPVLVTPVHGQLVLGTPVLDPDWMTQALTGMLDAVAADPALPKILQATEVSADGPLIEALHRVLAARRAPARILKRLSRPKLQCGLDGRGYLDRALSKEKRQQLRRRRRRLAEQGRLELTCHRTAEEVRGAFEEFLALEAAGWKGRGGSALSQRGPAMADFVRAMIEGLARDGLVTIMALRLDGSPSAMRVILRCGRVAYTWKTAYDESLRSYAPGLLLMEDVTLALLAEPGLDYADYSTNLDLADVKAQASFWTERLDVVDLLIDARRGGSIGFRLLGLRAGMAALRRSLHLRRRARRLRDAVRERLAR